MFVEPQAAPYREAAQVNDRNIGLSLTGNDVPLESFIGAAEKLAGLLSELELSLFGARHLDWYVADLRMGSANLAMRPKSAGREGSDFGNAIISAALSGLETIEREALRPEHFTDDALRRAKALVGSVDHEASRLIIFGDGGSMPTKQAPLTARLAVHVDQLIGPASVAVGSIEGAMEALSIHKGEEFAVYDTISDRRIRCLCDREMLNQVMAYLGSRMSVSGEVRFNVQGEPVSVKVASFLPLGREPLPRAEDLRGLFSDDRIDVDEWSRYVRKQ